jgi:preprotein translocase subunit SecG
MQQIIWLLHMACAVCIIVLVLLQHGKGAEMGASLGASASQTVFGSQGSGSFLTKLTTIFAVLFAITSISLSFFLNNKADNSQKLSNIILQQEAKHKTSPATGEVTDLPE